MQRHKLDDRGSTIIVLLFMVAAAFLVWKYIINDNSKIKTADSAPSSQSSVELETPSGSTDTIRQDKITLHTNFGYEGSGSAIRSYEGGQFELTISAALPALSEGGYYEAFLEGYRTIDLGRLQKSGTTYKLTYIVFEDLTPLNHIRISVNGADFTVEENSRTLPFDIMEGSF